jgi:nucleotide-binding universal stress UspA family protein
MTDRPELLVGVDGSSASADAVRWAVAEAARRGCGVHIVHACDVSGNGLWATPKWLRNELRSLTRPIVEDALSLVRVQNASVPARGSVVLGAPAATLLRMAAATDLVVVGHRGIGALATHLLGSVASRLMTLSPCPVAVIRPGAVPGGRTDPAGGIARVVYAVGDRLADVAGDADSQSRCGDCRASASPAMTVAAAEAALHGVPLVALRAATTDLEGEIAHLRAAVRAGAKPPYGQLIEPMVRFGSPVSVLSECTGPADLLVIGHHRLPRPHPAFLGPVAAGLVHRPGCPLIVVGEPAEQSVRSAVRAPSTEPAPGLLAY